MYNIYSPESKGQFSSQSTANFSSGKIQTQPRIKCLNKQTFTTTHTHTQKEANPLFFTRSNRDQTDQYPTQSTTRPQAPWRMLNSKVKQRCG